MARPATDARSPTEPGPATRRRVPRQARSQERVRRILAVSRQLLEQEGPEALTTNRIAREAGMGVGSLYEYFPDKHAIAFALLDDLSAHETDRVMACIEGLQEASLPALVAAVVELTYGLYREHHALYRSLWSMTPVLHRVGHRPSEELVIAAVRERLAPHADELGIQDLALTCWTAFHLVESLTTQFVSQGRFSPERGVAEITRVVLRYLGLPEATGV